MIIILKNKTLMEAAILIILLFETVAMQGQIVKRIPVNAAIDTAFKNNLQYGVNTAQVNRSVLQTKTAYEIPKTGVFAENEDLQPTDKKGILKIGVSQNIEWPGLYKARKNYFNEQLKYYQVGSAVIDVTLKRDVRTVYYQLWYLQEKQKLFKRLDSIYSSMYSAAKLRVRVGEVAGLDSIAAEVKMKELQAMLQQLGEDMKIQQQGMMQLLNTAEMLLPVDLVLEKLALPQILNDSLHPVLALQQQNINIANANIGVQQNSNKPEFSGRVFSQRLYGVSNPYSGFSATVAFPLFGSSAYRSKVKVAKAEVSIEEKQLEYQSQLLNTQRQQTLNEILKNQSLLRFYETTGLRQADEIIKAASIAYRAGEIGFAELSQFLTQAIDIQKNYLDNLNEYNQSIIQYNYLINQ